MTIGETTMTIKRKSLSLFASTAVAVMMCFVTPARASLIVSPAAQAIIAGDTVGVNIDITGLGNGVSPALAAYSGVVLTYDSSILLPVSVTFSNRLGDPTDPSQTLLLSNLFLPSAVQVDGVSFLSNAQLFAAQTNPNNEFTLATINFEGLANGVSSLTLAYGALSDENGNALAEAVVNGSLTVSSSSSSTMPEPAAAMLAGIGLAASLIALRLRTRQQA
jgi:hypothetical protein